MPFGSRHSAGDGCEYGRSDWSKSIAGVGLAVPDLLLAPMNEITPEGPPELLVVHSVKHAFWGKQLMRRPVLRATLALVNTYVSAPSLATFPLLMVRTGWAGCALIVAYVVCYHRAAKVLLALVRRQQLRDASGTLSAPLHSSAPAPRALAFHSLFKAVPHVSIILEAFVLADMIGVLLCYMLTLLNMALSLSLSRTGVVLLCGSTLALVGSARSDLLLQTGNVAGVACSLTIVVVVVLVFISRSLSPSAVWPVSPLVRPHGLLNASVSVMIDRGATDDLPCHASSASHSRAVTPGQLSCACAS